jgi:stearoyl-CoA desaturase (delta-9 desaturase)
MLFLSGLAITAGNHRYYSHRSYECHLIVKVFYLLFGAAAIQNSVLCWASRHRSHHRFVDQEGDPHNIVKGFFWAYIGWIFYKDRPHRSFENVPDLKADRLVMWQHRYYLPLGVGVGFILPFLIGFAFERPWGGLLWGGLFRVVVFHHITFLGNATAHYLGSQSYCDENSSRDNWWLTFLTFGEGYHNFHHAFPGDYRSGIAWYHWDPTKWWIYSLNLVGLTWCLNRTAEGALLRARLSVADSRTHCTILTSTNSSGT